MARVKSLTPSVDLHVMVPAAMHQKMTEFLWSDVEQRVPFGATQKFLMELLTGFFQGAELDLSEVAPTEMMIPPGFAVVRGTPMAIQQLKEILK